MHPSDKLLSAFVMIFVLLLAGTTAYHGLEGWSYVDSLYFTAMTVTTVGYGDFVPTTDASKIFTVFFSLTGIGIVLVILVTIGGDYYRREQRAFSARIQQYLDNKKKRSKSRKLKKYHKARRKKLEASKRIKVFNWGR